ncbi:hypothetical protein ACIQGO_25090 [Streptomyces shenzhenensis]|uniref:hypothetical protein n=1 Tax=Streptomyces shenzhenensis TaxID=943815 RepID=UPI0038063C6C
MKNTTLRRMTRSAAVATMLVAVAACGSPGSSGGSSGGSSRGSSGGDEAVGKSATRVSSLAALRSAEQSTDRAESAEVRSTTTMGSVLSMTADGSLGWGDGLTGTLTIGYTGGTVADAMRRLGVTSMQTRYLPDAYYARMSDAFAELAGGKHWIRYAYADLADLGADSGAYLRDQMRSSTPNQSVKLLLASGDVRKVGEEKVSGQHTTHYSGTVEVADLATRNSHLGASLLAELKKQLDQAGITTETVDIWVNDQDLLVKKIERGDTANGTMTSTAYYSDYGVRVSVQEPPAADTQDFRALVGRQGGSTA